MTISLSLTEWKTFAKKYTLFLVVLTLSAVSIASFIYYSQNGLGLAYNDARSHLNIGRRVVEGLKPGVAQLGSVWLPLTHLLMIPTIWNDFMWHSGLAGSIQSMIAFVGTGVIIYLFLRELGAGLLGRVTGVAVFAVNLNILYLQSTAMTELMLLATMTCAVYFLLLWYKRQKLLYLISAAFWIMLSSLVRYDGWFLLAFTTLLLCLYLVKQKGYKTAEGMTIFFVTLAAFGIFLWLLWNLLIFKDPLYFIFGPYSAYEQQQALEQAGNLLTKGDWLLSFKFYFYALAYNSNAFTLFLGLVGAIYLWLSRELPPRVRYATLGLLAPLFFNVLALYLGHSVLFIQGLSGNTWFNVRYGVMLLPSIAIFVGFLVHKASSLKTVLIGLLIFVSFFSFTSSDAVTIDDAQVGSSQKNVTEVSTWLAENAADQKGFVLISAASHDAIIFSSGLPMKKFIHEGTGAYWDSATTIPDHWARWIVMRTYSDADAAWRLVSKTPGLARYERVAQYPFADIYKLRDMYLNTLNTEPIYGKQK